jgi:hypothetical protein
MDGVTPYDPRITRINGPAFWLGRRCFCLDVPEGFLEINSRGVRCRNGTFNHGSAFVIGWVLARSGGTGRAFSFLPYLRSATRLTTLPVTVFSLAGDPLLAAVDRWLSGSRPVIMRLAGCGSFTVRSTCGPTWSALICCRSWFSPWKDSPAGFFLDAWILAISLLARHSPCSMRMAPPRCRWLHGASWSHAPVAVFLSRGSGSVTRGRFVPLSFLDTRILQLAVLPTVHHVASTARPLGWAVGVSAPASCYHGSGRWRDSFPGSCVPRTRHRCTSAAGFLSGLYSLNDIYG